MEYPSKMNIVQLSRCPFKHFIDQHQISRPCNINAYSIPDVMRIKDMITKVNFLDILVTSSQYFNEKSMGTR